MGKQKSCGVTMVTPEDLRSFLEFWGENRVLSTIYILPHKTFCVYITPHTTNIPCRSVTQIFTRSVKGLAVVLWGKSLDKLRSYGATF